VFTRRLPIEFGSIPLTVSPAAGLRYLLKPISLIDPSLLNLAGRLVHPGNVVWDIGANVGLFTFAAAHIAGSEGRVVAIEPDTWLVSLLRRSSRLQPETSAVVTVVPSAVASNVALREFRIAARSRASNSLMGYGLSQAGGYVEHQVVPAFTLDWLLNQLPSPHLIKCDVEGAEVEVFDKQVRMLETIRPVIVCEVSSEASPLITPILLRCSYRLYDGESMLEKEKTVDAAPWTTIAIPSEKIGLYFP
jgi:FkbM family methyltransferase